MSGTNPAEPKPEPAAGARSAKPTPPIAGTSELASALIRFSQRLANFGLGEVTDPLLDELGENSGKAHPSR